MDSGKRKWMHGTGSSSLSPTFEEPFSREVDERKLDSRAPTAFRKKSTGEEHRMEQKAVMSMQAEDELASFTHVLSPFIRVRTDLLDPSTFPRKTNESKRLPEEVRRSERASSYVEPSSTSTTTSGYSGSGELRESTGSKSAFLRETKDHQAEGAGTKPYHSTMVSGYCSTQLTESASAGSRESVEVSKEPFSARRNEKREIGKEPLKQRESFENKTEGAVCSYSSIALLPSEELERLCERNESIDAKSLKLERSARKESEEHEKELEEQLDALQIAYNDLDKKYKRLLKGRQLEETLQIGVDETTSLLSQTDADQELELITMLFSCQAKDFSVIRLVASGCEGAVFLAKCTNRRLLRFGHKVFALKVLFNIFSYSTYTKVSWLIDFYGLPSSSV